MYANASLFNVPYVLLKFICARFQNFNIILFIYKILFTFFNEAWRTGTSSRAEINAPRHTHVPNDMRPAFYILTAVAGCA